MAECLTNFMKNDIDKKFMLEALKEARKAFAKNEVPIGAVIVKDNKVISRGYNKTEKDADSTSHAEIEAIRKAAKKFGDWRLNGCSIYVTVEPCLMCFGAIKNSRISKLVYGIKEPEFGSLKYLKKLPENLEISGGIFKEQSRKLLQDFFKKLRKK